MPRKRTIKLDGYGISKHRYQELKSFCLQYPEWKDELEYKTDTVQSKNITDMPVSRTVGNATESLAIKRIELKDKSEMVEKTLIKAIKDVLAVGLKNSDFQIDIMATNMYPRMLKAITNDDINYAYLDEVMDIPCGRNTYWKIRRYFFFLLSFQRK